VFDLLIMNDLQKKSDKLLEESAEQMTRNMQSIRCDLQPYVELGLLRFVETRMYQYGIEEHLARFHQSIVDFAPSVAVFDPLSVLHHMEDKGEFRTLVVRVVNFLKARQITTLLTVGIGRGNHPLTPDVCLSSSIDSWVALLDVESNGERTRLLQIMKSRGMAHSNQLREFKLTGNGIELIDVYTGKSGVLTGTARIAQEAEELALSQAKRAEASCRARNLATRLNRKNAQIAALEAAFAAEEVEHEHLRILDQMRTLEGIHSSQQMAKAREADSEVAAVHTRPPKAD
jgi:circadian clock protein KaiC